MEPLQISKFFHEDIMYLIRKQIEYIKSGNDVDAYEEVGQFNRLARHNDPFFCEIHHMIKDRVSKLIGAEIIASYNFTSMYFVGQGICHKHTDRPQCKYTLSVCINQDEIWPINISGKEYNMECGDAVLYSGTDNVHYRNKIQDGNYCDLIFFHFVPVDFEGHLE